MFAAAIAFAAAHNPAAAAAHVAAHPAEVDAVLASFGLMDQMNASQIYTFSGINLRTVECMVETGLLTMIGYNRGGSPVYSL